MNILKKSRGLILDIVYKIRYLFSKDTCYDQMKTFVYAYAGKCGGICGGDKSTNGLAYSCLDCAFLEIGFDPKKTN